MKVLEAMKITKMFMQNSKQLISWWEVKKQPNQSTV